MKYFLFFLCMFFGLAEMITAQPGLDGVIIERYYVADTNDASTPDFPVPSNAKTYRVYVDLATGWGLQAIFASTNISTGDVDTLVIRSTQPFFNNEDRGRVFGYQISTNNLDENTVNLDSWFSTGRSSNTTDGVLKPEDTNAGTPAFPNLDGLLQNDDPSAGIPIHTADGNIPGTTFPTWALTGITLADLAIFDNIDLLGNEMIVNDGAMSNFSTPLQGPNSNNRVLIGQFTTAGTFSGQVNLQIRNMTTGVVQQWVAESPTPSQFSSPTLRWKVNDPPIVVITSPSNNTRYLSGDTVHVTVDAMDPDSAILNVEFFYNGLSIFTDYAIPFQISFPAAINGNITAVATGDAGGQATSEPVFMEVVPYRVDDLEQLCNAETVCLPVSVFGEGISDIVGFDIKLSFDPAKIIPTGYILNSDDLVNKDYYDTDHFIDIVNEEMLISVFLNGNAPLGTSFSGIGEILCVEFLKRPGFKAEDSTIVWITSIQESFTGGGVVQFDSIPPGVFSTIRNTAFFGSLSFWSDHSPIKYDPDQPGDYLATYITGISTNCDTLTGPSITPGPDGSFRHDLSNGVYLDITRDIDATTDVQSVINSFDAFLTRKVLIEDPSFVPDVFQIIAMDVNMDGVISAGDVSQINQRSVLILDEFRQSWNYNGNGMPKPDYGRSKDWLFVSRNTLLFDPSYQRSTTYPRDNGHGYSRYRVPLRPSCTWTEIDDLPDVCAEQKVETYIGILLGDSNGNYRSIPPDGVLK